MKNHSVLCLCIMLFSALGTRVYGQAIPAKAAAASAAPAEVVVLCTLHQLHEETPGYSYSDLKATLERLHPDVLAVELTPTDLTGKVVQKNKREYQNAVYPLLERHGWKAVAMEPEGTPREKLYVAMHGAEESLEREFPQKVETAQIYIDALYSYVRERWHSAADVNSSWTDDLFAVKHAFQEKLYGPGEVEAWEGWNQNFLNRILEAATANPGKRIVVTVGAEHGYWLRAHLSQQHEVRLLNTAAILEKNRK